MRANQYVTLAGLFSLSLFLSASCADPGASVGKTGSGGLYIEQHPTVPLCPWEARPGYARCHSRMRTDVAYATSPQGFGPPDLVSAYNLPTSGGSGATVAIVDAQDDPNAEADVAVYRSTYRLPPCTTSNGCFKKVNQNGVQGSYPSADAGWSGEISLDLDMVSAACPSCNILLVEANSATDGDLGAAVNTAASMGANAISNSYGGPEDSSVTSSSASYYNHPGILVTASNGDSGYGASFPASSQYVLAVGGTSLVKDGSSRGWSEVAWNSTGSGCSGFIPKPSWQTDTGCGQRTVGDVSAVADPNTGVAVYDTYGGGGGWNVYGGTSAASPLVAAIFALTGKAGSTPQFPYSNTGAFYDVTSGSDGSCGGSYLCTAGVGYDGPTGWGTPNGQAILTGSGGGTGGSGGAGGTGGSGGTGGGGAGGSGSGSDAGVLEGGGGDGGRTSGYAFEHSRTQDRRHELFVASGATITVSFAWHDAPGLEPAADLAIEVEGETVLQVASVGHEPFVRAGLEVRPIERDASYRLEVSRSDDTVTVSVLSSSGEALLRTHARATPALGPDAPTANVVLPSADAWRESVVMPELF